MTSKYKVSNGGDRHDDLPAKKDIVLACGSGSGAALPINSGPVPIGFLPAKVVVATVTLDTSKLDKPTVRIDFSSIVNFLAQPGSGGLSRPSSSPSAGPAKAAASIGDLDLSKVSVVWQYCLCRK